MDSDRADDYGTEWSATYAEPAEGAWYKRYENVRRQDRFHQCGRVGGCPVVRPRKHFGLEVTQLVAELMAHTRWCVLSKA